jgi:predicted secreted protein
VSPIPTVIQPGGSPVPRTLSPADDGRVYTMQVDQTSGLVVPDPNAPDPEVEGDSVDVVAIANVGASGQREWELRAIAAGRTVLRGAGAMPYTITLDVGGP